MNLFFATTLFVGTLALLLISLSALSLVWP